MSARRAASAGAALLAGTLWTVACAPETALPGPDVVARLDGADVLHSDFEAHLERNLGDGGEALASEALSQLLDQFLVERLLARLAVDRGLVPAGGDPVGAADALLGSRPTPAPTEVEIATWFAAHRAELARPERVELAQILTQDRVTAERARREILAGADFAAAAHRVSTDPAAGSGGVQGVFAREDLPPAIGALIFRMKEGEVSDVVEADYGFLLFRVLRRWPAENPDLAGARSEIESRLAAEHADRALARLVSEARSRYAVEVFDRNLPFVYRGSFPITRPYDKKR